MYILIKPRNRNVRGTEYGTLDAAIVNDDWMPFKTFDEAYAYLTNELGGDERYFIFEWVGTEHGRISDK